MRSSSPARRWTTRTSSRASSSSCALACPTRTRCASSASSAAPRASRRRRSASTSRRAAARRGFVLKREPLAGLLEPYDLEPEFRVLHALVVRSPALAARRRGSSAIRHVLERPFYVMERLPGDVPDPGAGPGRRRPVRRRRARSPRRRRRRRARAAARRSTGAPPGSTSSATRARARQRPRASWRAGSARIAAQRPGRRSAAGRGARLAARATSRRPTRSRSCTATFASATSWSCATAGRRAPERRPRLGDGAPRRPARGRRVVHLAALARRDAATRPALLPPEDFVARWATATRPRRRSGAAATSTACSRSSR